MYSTNPLTNTTSVTNDGSYALFVRMNDLGQNESDSFTWYYAAGDTASLLDAIGRVAREAASWTDRTVEALAARGQHYQDSVLASGSGAISYSALAPSGSISSDQTSGLPPFLSLNGSTGAITGTAPNDTSADGIYVFRIRATDVDGESSTTSDTPNLTITVGATPTLSNLAWSGSGMHSAPLTTFSFAATGNFPAPTFSTTPGDLPDGVSLNSTTGLLSGTPTEFGEFTFVVTATNAFGPTTSGANTLRISRDAFFPSEYSNLDNHTFVGDNTNPYLSSIEARGYPAPQYSVIDDPISTGISYLPPGLSINSSTGNISGVASAIGTYPFRIHVQNGVGSGDSTSSQTIVVASEPSVTFDNIAAHAYLGVEYNDRPTFGGYPNPTFRLSGDLPDGLSMSENGTISGKPTKAGTSSFRVCAEIFGRETCTKEITIRVYAEPVYKDNTALPPIGQYGTPYSGRVKFHGVIDTYRIAAHETGLPQGLALNPTTGIIAGVPAQTGVFRFKVTARGPPGLMRRAPPRLRFSSRVRISTSTRRSVTKLPGRQ